MIRASVIIPNWNGKHLLKVCLNSLLKQSFKNFEIVLVDNGSVDESVDYVKKYFPQVKIISLDKNYGFAKAVNKGIKNSLGKYIVLVNNDTEVDKNCLKFLVAAAKDRPSVGFVAAKMLKFHDRRTIDSCGDFIDVVGHADNIGRGKIDGPEFEKPGPVFLVTGGGGLFKKEVFNQVGLMDEDFFAYFEDVDLCLRAQIAGFKGWFEPRAKIYHIHKATAQKINSLVEYLQFRNMTQTIIKDFPGALLVKDFNWLKILLVNLNTIRFMATKGFFWQALKAEGWTLFHLPELLVKRNLIQKNKKVSDQYIIDNFVPKTITLFGLLARGI